MKTVRVSAGVICSIKEGDTGIFATARGYGEFEGLWEFPGGKPEEGETPQEALVRELWEELGIRVQVLDLLDTIDYAYPEFRLIMHCFKCVIAEGEIVLREAKEGRWLSLKELNSVKWLPADIKLVERLGDLL